VLKINLDELICLENITNTQSTYFIIDLKLTKLFKEILKNCKNGIIPILETRLLLHTLINTPFSNEFEGTQMLKDLTNCMENHWYSLKDTWNYKTIISKLRKLRKFVLYDYLISGFLIMYSDDYIYWEIKGSMIR
jgi:hypothetical protein